MSAEPRPRSGGFTAWNHYDYEFTKGFVMYVLRIGVLVLLGALLSGCGYNRLQQQDEQVTAAWSEVLNQYQRRADLVPNLVNTVKGAVAAEKDILDSVIEARARATSIQATPELVNNPRSEEHTSELQSRLHLVCRLLLEKKKTKEQHYSTPTTDTE